MQRIFGCLFFLFLLLVSLPTASAAICDGELSGLWNLNLNQQGSCTYGGCDIPNGSFPLSPFSLGIEVCHEGTKLSGTLVLPPVFGITQKYVLSGTVTPAGQDGIVDDRVRFKIDVQTDYGSFDPCKLKEEAAFDGEGVVMNSGNLSGDLAYSAEFIVTCSGCSTRTSCKNNGNFSVKVTDVVSDVSDSSGISKNTVETSAAQWTNINNDKFLDLLLVGRNGNGLFKNVGKGKFVDATGTAKVGNGGKDARGACSADFDNDGDADLLIANATGSPTLLKNNKGVFSDVSNMITSSTLYSAAGETEGAIWLDYNRDGRVDALIVKDGAPNQLLENRGSSFVDVASQVGLNFNGHSRAAVSADFDRDGFPDIYLVNFNQPNKLYKNNGGAGFTDVAPKAGAAFSGGSVQAVITDFNRDRKPDLFVVNNTGPSVTYKNLGNMKFKKVTTAVGLAGPKKGKSASFVDSDNDGDEDLVLVQSQGGNLLFRNDFVDSNHVKFVKVQAIDLDRADNPTSVTTGDFNGDGQNDIMIGDGDQSQENGDSLYQNNDGGNNNYLIVILQGTVSNKSAIGAEVVVTVASGLISFYKTVSGGNGSSQDSLPVEFGLGGEPFVDSVEVIWPSGKHQILSKPKINTTITMKEPAQ